MPTPPPSRDVSLAEIDRLVSGYHSSPHDVLGPHVHEGRVLVRTLRPLARSVSVRTGSDVIPMKHEHAGVWVAELPDAVVPDYRLEVTYDVGAPHLLDDPYRYLPPSERSTST